MPKFWKIFSKPKNTEGVEVGRNVEQQATGQGGIYELVKPSIDATGQNRGILVEETAKAFKENNFKPLHDLIREKVKPYLYNEGNGKYVSVNPLIEVRHTIRQREKKRVDEKNRPVHLFKRTKEEEKQFKANSNEMRFCCWDIDRRGAVGETILHLCFLNNTRAHNLLAQHLIEVFPNLLHDVYHSEEYYGEGVLHMALANEDFNLLKIIVHEGSKVNLNLHERCFGNFFCPDDQKPTRRDDPSTEVVVVDADTDYKGFTYWGELALSFSACLNQPDAFKLLIDHGADLFETDTNGNNVLHMMVIQNNKDMFNLAYRYSKGKTKEEGKSLLDYRNKLGYTPLTLAAKLANKEMFDHILELKSITLWAFGEVVCKEYPVSDLDSIKMDDGSINDQSALSIILSEESTDHLDMLDGLLQELLHEKWKSYAKVRFYRRGVGFLFYAALLIAASYLHPGQKIPITSPSLNQYGANCYIPTFTSNADYARTIIEASVYLLAMLYIWLAVSEIRNQGFKLFIWTLHNAPTKASFLISCVLVILVLPCRMSCATEVEDVFISLGICTCLPYCLFFCRGFKLVGPFIVMIYKMIGGDLLRFLIIYLIFLLGFSQAMFVVFRGTDHEFFSSQFESVMAMFSMTLGEFGDIYETFDTSRIPAAPKVLFLFYMVLVTILLLNMLIAMMGNTFNRIAQTHKEWQRQWAKIVLVMEHSVSPTKRRSKQRRYYQPMGDLGKERGFVIRKRIKREEGDRSTMQRFVNRFQKNLHQSDSEDNLTEATNRE